MVIMENVGCALCHSKSYTKTLTARDPDFISEELYNLVKCNECGLVFTNPQPCEEELSKFYTQQYYGRLKIYPYDFIERILNWFQQLRVKRVKKRIQSGRVLDIGCGKGLFLGALLKEGFQVYGIETSQANKDDPALKKLNISCADLTELAYPESFFDVITLWHVFEHISNPREILKKIKEIIKKEGVLIMTMPNFQSWEANIAGKNWFHLDLPRHLYHYTPFTLEKMLNNEGFTVVKKGYFSLEFGPFGVLQTIINMLGGEFNFLAKVLKRHPLSKFQAKRKNYTLALSLFLFLLLPLIVIFSIIEDLYRKGGVLEIYAKAVK